MGFIEDTLLPIPLPKVVKVQQNFSTDHLDDIVANVSLQITNLEAYKNIKAGQKIAITGGSRSIDRLGEVTRIVCDMVKKKKAFPFVIPAMGSHGGATAKGQIHMLETVGITEESVGVPIRASMDVVQIGCFDDDSPIFMDRFAHFADGVILINRIKSHPSFRATYESGLMKMMAIGLGKQKGAQTYHQLGYGNLPHIIETVGKYVIKAEKILFGVALLENSFSKLRKIAVIPAHKIPEEEAKLLKESYGYLAQPFFRQADVLIVKDIGKNISGACCDVTASGRFNNEYFHSDLKITRLVFLNLTQQSKGNASGVGVADFITKRLFDNIDFLQTYPNALTTGSTIAYKIPIILANDILAFKAAIKSSCIKDFNNVRLCVMESSKNMSNFYVTPNMISEAKEKGVNILTDAVNIPFDENGNLNIHF
jgi:hypothetical protein